MARRPQHGRSLVGTLSLLAASLWAPLAAAQGDAPAAPDESAVDQAVNAETLFDAFNILKDELLSWAEAAIRILPELLIAVVVFFLFVGLSRVAARLTAQTMERLSDNKEVASLLQTAVRSAVTLLGFFIALRILGLTGVVTSLLAGVGVVGLALGFAFQDIAANFVSGVLLAFSRPYKIGDLIRSGGFFGTVEGLDLRNTYIRTLTGEQVIVPNKEVYGTALTNYTQSPFRRIDIAVGVSYGDDLKAARDAVVEALKAMEHAVGERPVRVFFSEFGESSINFTASFWTRPANQGDFNQARSDAVITIKAALDRGGLTIPFPIRTLDFGARAAGGVRLDEVLNPKASD